MPLILFIGCAKDDRPICPSCGERATMQMHPRMPEIAEMGWAQTHYKCQNNHNFTRGGELVDAFGMPLKKESVKQIKEPITKNESALDSVTFEELEKLPGVGHKTASVVMSQGFGYPAFAIDTHIHRLAQRWGLTNGKNVIQTEKDLKRIFPKKTWSKLHLQIIFYGREYCKARDCYGLSCKICTTCYPNRKKPVITKKA